MLAIAHLPDLIQSWRCLWCESNQPEARFWLRNQAQYVKSCLLWDQSTHVCSGYWIWVFYVGGFLSQPQLSRTDFWRNSFIHNYNTHRRRDPGNKTMPIRKLFENSNWVIAQHYAFRLNAVPSDGSKLNLCWPCIVSQLDILDSSNWTHINTTV